MSREHVGSFNIGDTLKFAKGILLLEDCEGTLVWNISGNAGDYAGTFETAAAFFATKGLELVTRVTNPAENDLASAQRYLPYPKSELVVLRALIGLPDVSKVKYVSLNFYAFDGAMQRRATLFWYPNVPKLERKNSAGGDSVISGYGQTVRDGIWTSMTVVLDLNAFEYLACELLGIHTSLEGLAMLEVGASTDRHLSFVATVCADGAAAATVYWDSLYCGEFEEG